MGIPDEKGRRHILSVMCRNLSFARGFDFQTLSRLTPGYVGSDLKSLIKCAANFAVDRHFNAMRSEYQRKREEDGVFEEELLLLQRFGDNEFFSWLANNSEANAKLEQLSVTFQVHLNRICRS